MWCVNWLLKCGIVRWSDNIKTSDQHLFISDKSRITTSHSVHCKTSSGRCLVIKKIEANKFFLLSFTFSSSFITFYLFITLSLLSTAITHLFQSHSYFLSFFPYLSFLYLSLLLSRISTSSLLCLFLPHNLMCICLFATHSSSVSPALKALLAHPSLPFLSHRYMYDVW